MPPYATAEGERLKAPTGLGRADIVSWDVGGPSSPWSGLEGPDVLPHALAQVWAAAAERSGAGVGGAGGQAGGAGRGGRRGCA